MFPLGADSTLGLSFPLEGILLGSDSFLGEETFEFPLGLDSTLGLLFPLGEIALGSDSFLGLEAIAFPLGEVPLGDPVFIFKSLVPGVRVLISLWLSISYLFE